MIIATTDILSRREVTEVLTYLTRRQPLKRNPHQNMVIFRLTIGAGLRASEICGLELRDVCVVGDRPHIAIRAEIGKGKKARVVPLWWDVGTRDALGIWKRIRAEDMFAQPSDPFVCVLQSRRQPSTPIITSPVEYSRAGNHLIRQQIYEKWKSCVGCLGPERQRQLHPHSGRHTFAAYMLPERGLPAVRDAMGHTNISVTSLYLHVLAEDLDRVGNVFGPEAEVPPEAPPADAV